MGRSIAAFRNSSHASYRSTRRRLHLRYSKAAGSYTAVGRHSFATQVSIPRASVNNRRSHSRAYNKWAQFHQPFFAGSHLHSLMLESFTGGIGHLAGLLIAHPIALSNSWKPRTHSDPSGLRYSSPGSELIATRPSYTSLIHTWGAFAKMHHGYRGQVDNVNDLAFKGSRYSMDIR